MYNAQLDAFICVADNGSFNRAAEKLFLSSTAVIKKMNALEEHLKLKLINRTNRGISLTPAGAVIYRCAKQMIALSQEFVSEAEKTMQGSEKTFCVGTSILNPCKPFMDVWYKVGDRFPGYNLHIVPFEDNHEGIISEIEALGKKFDFLVAGCDSKIWLSRCNFLQLGTYDQCIAVNRNHPLARRKKVSVSDLKGYTVMMVKKGDSETCDEIRAELVDAGISIEDTSQFYDIEVFNRCGMSDSVLVTLDCWENVHPSLVTIPVRWKHRLPYGILYQKDYSEEIKAVIDAIAELRPTAK